MSEFKYVPVEPTEEMIDALSGKITEEFGIDNTISGFRRAYKSMLAAAPTTHHPEEYGKESVRNTALDEAAKGCDEIEKIFQGDMGRAAHLCSESILSMKSHPSPAESDKEAVRNAALEEAAKVCDKETDRYPLTLDGCCKTANEICSIKIRALKTQPLEPSDAEMLDWLIRRGAEVELSKTGWFVAWVNKEGHEKNTSRNHDDPKDAIKEAMSNKKERL